MPKCRYCEKPVPDTALFCPYCGKKIERKRLCPQCHSEVGEDDKFCMSCGMLLDSPHLNMEKGKEERASDGKDEAVMLVSCPKCGKLLDEKMERCPECGCSLGRRSDWKVSMIVCPSCGESISDMNRICPKCGCLLTRNVAAASTRNAVPDTVSATHPASSHKIHRPILVLIVLVILVLSFLIWMWLRHPQGSMRNIHENPPVEQMNGDEDVSDMVSPSGGMPDEQEGFSDEDMTEEQGEPGNGD